MSKINNQIQHEISNLTKLGQKKKKAQEEARIIYKEKHGNLEGYNISKTYSIRSINTALAYRNSGEQFAAWLKDEKSINKIKLVTKEFAGEYLKQRQEKGFSAWTLKKDLAAINKIFDFNLTSKELDLKERKLSNIKRSRSGPDENRPGLIKKCREQIYLINACGCRRESVTKVKYKDIIFDENNVAVKIHLIEKGGKHREAPILDIYKKEFTAMFQKYEHNYSNIFNDFDNHVSAHYYRHLYAKSLYLELCKKILPATELYKGYRVEVLKEVSIALGHNRINVVVNSYFY